MTGSAGSAEVAFSKDYLSNGVPRRLLTPGEAAELLAVSERKVSDLARSGQLPCVHVGRSVRFRPADIERLIEGPAKAPLGFHELHKRAMERRSSVPSTE